MKFIAHRGNTQGPNPEKENDPDYIQEALEQGYDAEIDLWYTNGEWWLGHDHPTYTVSEEWLLKHKYCLWCHAKHIEALVALMDLGMNCFWHDQDNYVVTSHGYIWAFPGQRAGASRTVAVMPEVHSEEYDLSNFYAVCSDFAR